MVKGRTFTGAWIEIEQARIVSGTNAGRTFTGAWIEMVRGQTIDDPIMVAPSQVRGLKYKQTMERLN